MPPRRREDDEDGEGENDSRPENHDPTPVAVEERPGEEGQGEEPPGQLGPQGAGEEHGKRGDPAPGGTLAARCLPVAPRPWRRRACSRPIDLSAGRHRSRNGPGRTGGAAARAPPSGREGRPRSPSSQEEGEDRTAGQAEDDHRPETCARQGLPGWRQDVPGEPDQGVHGRMAVGLLAGEWPEPVQDLGAEQVRLACPVWSRGGGGKRFGGTRSSAGGCQFLANPCGSRSALSQVRSLSSRPRL